MATVPLRKSFFSFPNFLGESSRCRGDNFECNRNHYEYDFLAAFCMGKPLSFTQEIFLLQLIRESHRKLLFSWFLSRLTFVEAKNNQVGTNDIECKTIF